MIPAKNRERKCATCKYYQPSPLWRKGWCRNPLLYDRNTNHLVEAESLSCNRTFIDYWEPGDGSNAATGAAQRSSNPRIAPSIPMDTVDSEGNRDRVTGNTPMAGTPRTPGRSFLRSAADKSRPSLSIVTPEQDDAPPIGDHNAARTTRQIPKIDYPEDDDAEQPLVQQRVQQTRTQSRPASRRSMPSLTGPKLRVALIAIAALVLLGGGFLLTRPGNKNPVGIPATRTATSAAPSPTGYGDATATSNTPPTATILAGTVTVPATGKIAVGGWVQVNSSNGLKIRKEAGTASDRVFTLPSGYKAHIIDGPVSKDNYKWWKVDQYDKANLSASGWCVEDFLLPTTPPTPTTP